MPKEIKLKTTKKQEIIDITELVKQAIRDSSIDQGLCVVYVLHATAGILINENYDKGVCEDILDNLEKLFPSSGNYKHNCVDNNAHAHIKSALVGPSETLIIKNTKLVLGTWQGIGFIEFDGPRIRSVFVKVIRG